MDVMAIFEGLLQSVDTGYMRKDTQLNLGIIERHKGLARFSNKGLSNTATFLRSDRDVLKVWIIRCQPPSVCPRD